MFDSTFTLHVVLYNRNSMFFIVISNVLCTKKIKAKTIVSIGYIMSHLTYLSHKFRKKKINN